MYIFRCDKERTKSLITRPSSFASTDEKVSSLLDMKSSISDNDTVNSEDIRFCLVFVLYKSIAVRLIIAARNARKREGRAGGIEFHVSL